MMIKLLFLFSLVSASTPSASKVECDSVKEGVFRIPFTGELEGEFSELERHKEYQIERVSFNDNIIRYNLKWIDNCTYLLFDRKAIQGELPFPGKTTDTLKVEIYNVSEMLYEAQLSSNFSEIKMDVKVYKAE
ncbi:MAG: hypothetical protein R2793_07970 [Flavobacteriaceae bacterium]